MLTGAMQPGLVICSNMCMCLKVFALMQSSFDPQLMPGIALQRHPLLPHTHTYPPLSGLVTNMKVV